MQQNLSNKKRGVKTARGLEGDPGGFILCDMIWMSA
jgi:hypothetical protein